MKYFTLSYILLSLLTFASIVNSEQEFCKDLGNNFPVKSEVKLSDKFTITYKTTHKVIKNIEKNQTYGLYCYKDSQPDDDSVNRWFQIPITNVAVKSTQIIPWLVQLGVSNHLTRIKGLDKLVTPCIQEERDLHYLNEYIEDRAGSHQLVFTNAKDDKDFEKQVTMSYNEEDPLYAAEWIKFVAAFFNKEERANEVFNWIQDQYKCHRANFENIQPKPKVAMIEYSKDPIVNKQSWKIGSDKYIDQIIQASKSELIVEPNKEYGSDELSEFKDKLRDISLVIDKTKLNTLPTLESWTKQTGISLNPTSNSPPFIKNKSIIQPYGIVNDDGLSLYDEAHFSRPDIVLLDLLSSLYPHYNETYTPLYFNNFATSKPPKEVSSSDCRSVLTRYPLLHNHCTPMKSGFTDPTSVTSIADSANEGGLSTGGIVGTVFGVLILLGLVAGGVYYFKKNQKKDASDYFLRLSDDNASHANLVAGGRL